MAKGPEPVVLELAQLPREQLGPFLLLGLDKAAAQAEVAKHWADRLKWARKGLVKVALEDINWARDALGDADKWVKADAGSLNVDTTDGVLGQLGARYGLEGGQATRLWQPLDSEKPLADYAFPAEVPDVGAVRDALTVTPVPEALPAVPALLRQLAQQPLDPWSLDLPPAGGEAGPTLASQDAHP